MKLSFWSLCTTLVVGQLSAAPIPITNPSFENPALACAAGPTCFGALGAVPGWVVNPAGGVAVVFKPAIGGQVNSIPDGVQVLADGFGTGADVSQDTGVAIVPGMTYTLTVDVGRRLDNLPLSMYTVALKAGATTLVSDSNGLAPGPGNFLLDVLTYTAQAGDTGNLVVDLFATGSASALAVVNAQTLFDNVGLDGTLQGAPEPSAFVLGGLGLLPLMFLRRRRS